MQVKTEIDVIHRGLVIHSYTPDIKVTLPRVSELIRIEGVSYRVDCIEHIFPVKNEKRDYRVEIILKD